MSSQQNCERPEMTEADAVRAVYPRHTMKQLARMTGAPLDTARQWLYRRFNPAQRRHLAGALLAEMDRQDVDRSALRRRLAQWASED